MTREGAVSLDVEGRTPQSPTMEDVEDSCELLAGTLYAELPDDPPVEVDPRFVARLDDVAREQRRRNGRRTGLAVVAVAFAALVGLVAASGLFAARRIDVQGTVHLTADEV
ncbi:MAG TPA: hypothetical protein VGI86_02585, partial [Acidimicrobiia bacterium]